MNTIGLVLFSGGIDSLAALLYAMDNETDVYPFYCRLEHEYEKKEVVAFRNILKILDFQGSYVIDDNLKIGNFEQLDANIPLRNLYLAAIPLMYLGDSTFKHKDGINIYMQNLQRGEKGPDRNFDFNLDMSILFSRYFGSPVKVISPFAENTKSEIVEYIMDKFTDQREKLNDLINATIGCFSPEDGHCGACAACFRRFIALEYAEFKTEGFFRNKVLMWSGTKDYIKKMQAGKYDKQREHETLTVLKKHGLI